MKKQAFYQSVQRRKEKQQAAKQGSGRYYVKRVGLGERLESTSRSISTTVHTLRAWAEYAVCDHADDDRLVVYCSTNGSIVFGLHQKATQAEQHIQRLEE